MDGTRAFAAMVPVDSAGRQCVHLRPWRSALQRVERAHRERGLDPGSDWRRDGGIASVPEVRTEHFVAGIAVGQGHQIVSDLARSGRGQVAEDQRCVHVRVDRRSPRRQVVDHVLSQFLRGACRLGVEEQGDPAERDRRPVEWYLRGQHASQSLDGVQLGFLGDRGKSATRQQEGLSEGQLQEVISTADVVAEHAGGPAAALRDIPNGDA
ncbi:hypothetical protein B5P44_08625 [Mycobacterium sp. CBMA 213]|nr:hypothetical protein [Mycolicibacterium sp. CBMA 213]